jgi:hypothetical protein
VRMWVREEMGENPMGYIFGEKGIRKWENKG